MCVCVCVCEDLPRTIKYMESTTQYTCASLLPMPSVIELGPLTVEIQPRGCFFNVVDGGTNIQKCNFEDKLMKSDFL